MTYHIATDAVHFDLDAPSVEAAFAEVVAQGEWAPIDSAREQREIADGAWLYIRSDEDPDEICRGNRP